VVALLNREDEFVPALQVLRAVAALAVVLFHVTAVLPSHAVFDSLKSIFWFGFVGVDVFFVLSGYVVTSVAYRVSGATESRNFLLRRTGRIYGGYWPVLLLAATLVLIGVPATYPGGQWLGSILLIEPTMERNIVPVAYTLVYELWFYCVTAVVLVVTPQHYRHWAVLIAMGSLFFWQALLMSIDFPAWSKGQVPLPFLLSGIHLEFLFGAVVYIYRGKVTVKLKRILGALLCTFGAVALDAYWQFFGLTLVRALIGGMIGVGALLIALSAHRPQAVGAAKGIWQRIGDASFSLYLLHNIVLTTVSVVASKLLLARGTVVTEAAVALSAVSLSVVIALAWYQRIERPMYQWWCGWIARRG
jgi:exopolysaccharide production protein ExoZ